MRRIAFSVLTMCLLAVAGGAHAVTYVSSNHEPLHMKQDSIMKAGSKVYLFHSGMGTVKKAICAGDVLSVYREYPSDISSESKVVGKVRILIPLGDYYFKGEMVEGEARPGDLAKKGIVACYITPLA